MRFTCIEKKVYSFKAWGSARYSKLSPKTNQKQDLVSKCDRNPWSLKCTIGSKRKQKQTTIVLFLTLCIMWNVMLGSFQEGQYDCFLLSHNGGALIFVSKIFKSEQWSTYYWNQIQFHNLETRMILYTKYTYNLVLRVDRSINVEHMYI